MPGGEGFEAVPFFVGDFRKAPADFPWHLVAPFPQEPGEAWARAAGMVTTSAMRRMAASR